jgi:hypothetical protein
VVSLAMDPQWAEPVTADDVPGIIEGLDRRRETESGSS